MLKFQNSIDLDLIFFEKISISNYDRFLSSVTYMTHVRNGELINTASGLLNSAIHPCMFEPTTLT